MIYNECYLFRLYALQMFQWHPSNIVAHVDAAPFANRFRNLHFSAFVHGEEVGTRTVGRGLSIHNTLRDDSLCSLGVTLVKTARIGTCCDGDDECYETRVECRLA